MASQTPEFISQFIEDQFPEFFREQNKGLVEFVLAYFEYLEQENKTTKVSRQLLDNRNIDNTIDDFIIHFKKTFLQGGQFQNETDDKFLIKHISDLYQSKGSTRSIELLIRLLFGEEVEVFLPSERVLIPSQSKFFKPQYLELSPSDRTKNFIGKNVTGSSSGSTGFVESVVTKTIAQKRVTVAFLSNVIGNFKTGEFITDDGLILDAPKMVGSLSSITINNGGRNFAIGDLFQIESGAGIGGLGKAKITSVQDATGRVNFSLANGGYGYTVSNTHTRTLSSNATIEITNITNADANNDGFFPFENVQQDLSTITWISGMSAESFLTAANSGSLLIGATSGGTPKANGYWVQTGSGNTITVQVSNGNFGDADQIYVGAVSNASSNIQLDTVTNAMAIGEFLKQENRVNDANVESIVIGLNANNKPFINHSKSFLKGQLSNTFANVANVGSGVGADFEVGILSNQENLTLFTDIIGSNNQAQNPVPFSNVHVNASNSDIGFVDSITIDTLVGFDSLANSGPPFATAGGFVAGQYIFEANVVVKDVIVTNSGSGYTNSSTVTFTGGSPATTASGSAITDDSGTLQAIVLANNGIDYQSVPTISISGGSGGTASARMKASGNSIGAVGNIKSVPNTNHLIVRNLSNGNFTNGRTITNEGVNAFANVANNKLLGGTGYVNADTVTVSGGSPNVTATANFMANAANSGSVGSVTIMEPGTQYESNAVVTINTSTGSGASLSVNMDFGYGFPKSSQADLTTILYNALTFASFTIGTIASFKGVNPGSGYNLDPVPIAHNPFISGFNRRDIICIITGRNGVFTANENLQQTLSLPGFLVTHSNNTVNGVTLNANNDAIQLGEGVIQNNTNASGVIESSNATHIKVKNTIGTFNGNNIVTQSSGATIAPLSPSDVVANTTSAIATGTFKSIQNQGATEEQIKIRRLSFGQSFVSGATITGLSSGATATVGYAYQDDDTLPIGLNAVVNATVITANGVAQELEIVDSGFGYEQGDTVNLTAANTNFIVTGTANISKQGIGEGRWRDRKSFVSDINKIQDSDYYQEFSYVTKTGIALAKYEEQLKEILHVAGTKLFGEVVKTRKVDSLKLSSTGVMVANQTANNIYQS